MTYRKIIQTWWPLAASWMFMALELPALTSALARLPDSRIHLAAFGGIAFPFAMLIESPIIMLLPASTELCRDMSSYLKVRRFTMIAGFALTTIHLALAITPLFDLIVGTLVKMPAELVEPTRTALILLSPWTWSIAYRRFLQGVLIRLGHSRPVGIGTAIRLGSGVCVLGAGLIAHDVPGVIVASMAVTVGVLSEALFIGVVARSVLPKTLGKMKDAGPELTTSIFLHFYLPLAITSILYFLVNPLGSLAMSRMPQPVDSLAVWPVVAGLMFFLRSFGIAITEVIVALIDQPGAHRKLQNFTFSVAAVATIIVFFVIVTGSSKVIFEVLFSLRPELAALAREAFVFVLLMPACSALQSWYQGQIMSSRKTRHITEAVVVYLAVVTAVLAWGIVYQPGPGIIVAIAAFALALISQILYLKFALHFFIMQKS